MIKRSKPEVIDFSDNVDKEVRYCKSCLRFNFHSPLKNRLYPQGEPIPLDNENFLQCYNCGLIVPFYELAKEAKIKDTIDTVESPFETGKDFLGVDSRKLGKKKKKDKDMELDYIKDELLKQELRHGSTLLSYSEQIPQ